MNSLALRFYTVAVALICGIAIAYTIDQQHQAATWQTEAQGWQQLAARTVQRDRLAHRRIRVLVRRYNQLVVDTRSSQRRLLNAAQQSTALATSSVSTGFSGTAGASTVPAPAPVTAQPPTTATS
jgi:hypothetical protein